MKLIDQLQMNYNNFYKSKIEKIKKLLLKASIEGRNSIEISEMSPGLKLQLESEGLIVTKIGQETDRLPIIYTVKFPIVNKSSEPNIYNDK